MAQIQRKNPAEKVRTPTTLVLSLAFPVHLVNFPTWVLVLNVKNVHLDIYNHYPNSLIVIEFPLGVLLQTVDLHP
tara:strand:- start:352 stop:576 length:225 start_codon:yes stop_codon:yes gene_type:complete